MGNPWVNGEFIFDLSSNNIFTKDDENYINGLGIQQLNTIGEIYFLDIFLSKDNYVDLHYHSNASELTYCISGSATISFINPTPNEWQSFTLMPGEAVSIPQGFWHCAQALEENTHLLATHDTNNLQTVFGSDLLRLTPKEVMASIYCLDEMSLEEVLSPIKETIVIGPPADCERNVEGARIRERNEEHHPGLGFIHKMPHSDEEKMKKEDNIKQEMHEQEPKAAYESETIGDQSIPIPLYNEAVSPHPLHKK